MNLSEIITRVQRQFGDTSEAQITKDDIRRWVNDAQIDIVRRTECLQKHMETSVGQDDPSYELPSDFMFMKRVTHNGRRLEHRLLEDMDLADANVDTKSSGDPRYFYIWGSVLYIHPKPSTSGTANLDIFYVRAPATLSGDNDVPEIPIQMHEDLVRYAMVRAKELDDDLQGAERIGSEYDARVAQAQFEIKTQPIDSYPAVRALPGDM